ncbi:MAG: hypothetical protein DI537_11400 [Stutzerimonas stutzeri]|nr:MAG: hypothetical protein DI537_11400 [Stutzerimonas stutzeri]
MSRQKRTLPWCDTRDGVFYAFWNVDIVDAKGRKKIETKRLSLRTRDPDEAQNRFAAFLTEGRDLRINGGGAAGLTVTQALDDYLREHVGEVDDKGRPIVADGQRQENAVALLKAFFQNDPLISVDIEKCKAYTTARRAGTVKTERKKRGRPSGKGADSTIRRELVVLRAAAGHAAKRKRIGPTASPPTPMPVFDYPQEDRADGQDEAPWLTLDQLADLRKKAAERIEAAVMLEDKDAVRHAQRLADFIEVAYYTASRRDAIETLTWFQVKFPQNRIHLAKAGERRTKKRRPIVPIDPELRPTLERLDAEKANEWVLGASTSLYRPFVKLCEKIGVEGSPHILRHSRATHLLQDGVSIYDVARLLGDTVATVERVYGHHSAEFLAEVIQKRRGG